MVHVPQGDANGGLQLSLYLLISDIEMLHKLTLKAAHTVVCIAFSELLARVVTEHLNVFPLFFVFPQN